MVSLNVMWVQSFKIPDEVAIILFWSELLVLEVPPPLAAPPLRQLLNKLRCGFVTVSEKKKLCRRRREKILIVISVCSHRNEFMLKSTFKLVFSYSNELKPQTKFLLLKLIIKKKIKSHH